MIFAIGIMFAAFGFLQEIKIGVKMKTTDSASEDFTIMGNICVAALTLSAGIYLICVGA